MSYLPQLLAIQPDLGTALARIVAYEAACARMEWTRTDTTAEQERAYATIKARVSAAYNRLDLGPTDREKMAKEMHRVRAENAALIEVNAHLRERLKHSDAALVRLTSERREG